MLEVFIAIRLPPHLELDISPGVTLLQKAALLSGGESHMSLLLQSGWSGEHHADAGGGGGAGGGQISKDNIEERHHVNVKDDDGQDEPWVD